MYYIEASFWSTCVYKAKIGLFIGGRTVLMIVLVNLSCAFNDYTVVMINLRPCNYENGVYVPESIGHVLFPKNMLYAVDHVRLSQNMFHGHRVWSMAEDRRRWGRSYISRSWTAFRVWTAINPARTSPDPKSMAPDCNNLNDLPACGLSLDFLRFPMILK